LPDPIKTPTYLGEIAYWIVVDGSDHFVDLVMVKSLTAAETLKHFKIIEARMLAEQGKSIGAILTVRSDEHGCFQMEFKAYLQLTPNYHRN
jgi:hypothetical protein